MSTRTTSACILAATALIATGCASPAPESPIVPDKMRRTRIGAGAIDGDSPLDPSEYVDASFSAEAP